MSLKKLKTCAKKINWKKVLPVLLVLYVLFFCLLTAAKVRFDCAPDEKMKFEVVNYIADNMQLPHGGDEAILDADWGTSYAFKPYVSYIFSGAIVHFVKLFTTSFRWIVFAARWVSVIFVAGYAIMTILISKKLFKEGVVWRVFFVVLATLIPQILYIGGYINNDAIALFSIAAIIYAWIYGIEKKWNLKSCILLGVGVGICTLSYYNAFGYILCSAILFIATMLNSHAKFRKLLGKGLLILAVAFALSGWHYIRNAMIYNGDAFDLHTSKDYASTYAAEDYKPENRLSPKEKGYSFKDILWKKDWVQRTVQSFFGVFGYWQSSMRYQDYLAYEGVFSFGIFSGAAAAVYLLYYFIKKRRRMVKDCPKVAPPLSFEIGKGEKRILYVTLMIAAVIPVALSLYYSYNHDYQPQGRYIMPMLLPLVYFITCGYYFLLNKADKIKRNIILGAIIIFFVTMPIFVFFNFVYPMLPW